VTPQPPSRRPLRVAIARLATETNTFSPMPTTLDDFRGFQYLQGREVVRDLAGTRTYVGGMLNAIAERGWTPVPGLVTSAKPAGAILGADFETLLEALLATLSAARPVDAVCLALHGAGVAIDCDDIEGRTLADIRRLVGPRVPIVATLDLHANLTDEMVANADGLFGVHAYPHVDTWERGVKAVAFLETRLDPGHRSAVHVERLPMLVPPSSTDLEPMRRIRALCDEWEQDRRVLDCTVLHGFPMTDVPFAGASVLAMTNGDADLARTVARTVADALWEFRDALRRPLPGPREAVAEALQSAVRPVIIGEASDNPGCGGPGDGTHLLRALVEAEADESCFATIHDPASVLQATAAGVGAEDEFSLGGRVDPLHGPPLRVRARVMTLGDGRFTYTTPQFRGLAANLGPMARLRIGRGLDVLVASRRDQVFDDEVLRVNGIDAAAMRIIAVKSSHHYRAGFAHISSRVVTCDGPGITSQRIERLGHRRVRRPIWPLDSDVEYAPV